jgi:fluoroacetyl-CoA thioesterase
VNDQDPTSTATLRATVSQEMTAEAIGRETGEAFPDVLASPVMISYIERTCAQAMMPLLQEGQMTVGVKFEITHFKPTPVGAEFATHSTYTHPEKGLYWFDVQCEDEAGPVAKGRHARAIVDRATIVEDAGKRRAT